jgi:hypothetical protein
MHFHALIAIYFYFFADNYLLKIDTATSKCADQTNRVNKRGRPVQKKGPITVMLCYSPSG